MRSLIYFALYSLFLMSCSSTPHSISYNVTLCCPENYSQYRSYTLATDAIPGFLDGTMINTFDMALREKGLQKTNQDGDLAILLRYVHVNLDTNTNTNTNTKESSTDPLSRKENYNQTQKYLATIEIEIRERSSATLIWSGNIKRLHRVQPGQHMHEDIASSEILTGFREVLATYPAHSQ